MILGEVEDKRHDLFESRLAGSVFGAPGRVRRVNGIPPLLLGMSQRHLFLRLLFSLDFLLPFPEIMRTAFYHDSPLSNRRGSLHHSASCQA